MRVVSARRVYVMFRCHNRYNGYLAMKRFIQAQNIYLCRLLDVYLFVRCENGFRLCGRSGLVFRGKDLMKFNKELVD